MSAKISKERYDAVKLITMRVFSPSESENNMVSSKLFSYCEVETGLLPRAVLKFLSHLHYSESTTRRAEKERERDERKKTDNS